MGKSSTEIRQDIDRTRHDMEATVDALGYKLDVKQRAKGKVSSLAAKPKAAVMRVRDSVTGAVSDAGDTVGDASGSFSAAVSEASSRAASTVSEHVPDPSAIADTTRSVVSSAGERTSQLASTARQNPVALALGGVAVGVLAGLAVPRTRVEDEKLGPLSDQVKETVIETGQDAIEHGKEVVQTTAEAAIETAKDETATHAKQLTSEHSI